MPAMALGRVLVIVHAARRVVVPLLMLTKIVELR